MATAVGMTIATPVVAEIANKAHRAGPERGAPLTLLTPDDFTNPELKVIIPEAAGTAQIQVSGEFDSPAKASPACFENTKTDEGYLPPYSSEFESLGLEGWTLLDLNEDGKSWVYANAGAVRLEYNKNEAQNDWLISPAIICEANRVYTLTFDYKVQSKASPERFEVAFGNAPTAAAMTHVLFEPTVVANQTYITETIRFIPEENGPVYLGFHCISDADTYALYFANINLSAGASTAIPEAVSDLTITPKAPAENAAAISFTAPAKTFVGNPLGTLTKIELKRDGEIIKTFESPEPGATLSWVDNVPVGDMYGYSVLSYNDQGVSPEVSASQYIGSLTIPFNADFVNNGTTGWNIVDGNDDGKVWTISSGAIRMQYNTYVDMDDWLITPPIKMTADQGYKLTFQTKCHKVTHPEKLIVAYGPDNTAESMTTVLLDTIYVTENAYKEYEAIITPPSTGTYSVGFHGVSPKGMFYLYLQNIATASGVSTVAPGAPTELMVTPGENAARNAFISFRAPSETLNGNPLADLTEVRVYRNDELIRTFESPQPGEELSLTDEVPASGRYNYKVIGSNLIGDGLEVTESVLIGFFPPVAPASVDISLTAKAGEVKVDWAPVTRDDNNVSIPSEYLTYSIYNGTSTVASGLTDTSYTYQAVEDNNQAFVQVAVYGVADGVNGHPSYSEMIPAGNPYGQYEESFEGGKLHYILGSTPILGGAVKLAKDDTLPGFTAMDGDNGYLYVLGQTTGSGAEFFTGLISLADIENPGFEFHTFNIRGDNGIADTNRIQVSARRAGEADYEVLFESDVDEICGGEANSWGTARVSLAKYAGETVQLQVTAICEKYSFLMFDDLKVHSIPEKDLEAKGISAPARVKGGEEYSVGVSVANMGISAFPEYRVELYADDVLVEEAEAQEIMPGEFRTTTFTRFMSPLGEQAVNYYARIVCDDNIADNNKTHSISVAPITNTHPVPNGLRANEDGDGIRLTWSRPSFASREASAGVYTENFESGQPFADSFGNWTFIDGDDAPVGGFQSLILPGIDRAESKGSFWVWDTEWSDENAGSRAEGYRAYSGTKYLFSLFRADDGEVNDYAISPELSGDAQAVSFFAKSYSGSYPEAIEVLYSVTGKEISDFENNVALTVDKVPGTWTEYSTDLPEGAKYFAIRSCATGSFMLMLDDVTFIPAEAQIVRLSLLGYNVYKNGRKCNDSLLPECEYVDRDVQIGSEYSFVVTAVYEEGESKGSNEVNLVFSSIDSPQAQGVSITTEPGRIVIKGSEGKAVSVVSSDGTVVYGGSGRANIQVAVDRGVYIVSVGDNYTKVFVR